MGLPWVMQKDNLSLTFQIDAEGVENEIEQSLLKALRDSQPQSVNRSFNIVANDNDGCMVAGLTGGTSYGWLLIKTLWVSNSYRQCGVGTELMMLAENLARDEGCHAAWLDTSADNAREFYGKLGYEPFGILENTAGQFPVDHKRWFMKKSL